MGLQNDDSSRQQQQQREKKRKKGENGKKRHAEWMHDGAHVRLWGSIDSALKGRIRSPQLLLGGHHIGVGADRRISVDGVSEVRKWRCGSEEVRRWWR
jgi:hypothetical protein